MKNLLFLVFSFILVGSFPVWAQKSILKTLVEREGGATSGRGNLKGISASSVVTTVKTFILERGTELYSEKTLSRLGEIFPKIKIIMTEEEIRLKVKGFVQNSDAFSSDYDEGYYIFIREIDWNKIEDPLEMEALVHHELMVLLGEESTGQYHKTNDFKSARKLYWKSFQEQNNYCSINVFEKQQGLYSSSPGKLLGNSVASISYPGSKGEMGVISYLDKNKALIWRGVIDTVGYFKMQIDIVGIHSKSKMIDLSNITNIEPMMIYSNPYSHLHKHTPVRQTENYWIMVNCNRF